MEIKEFLDRVADIITQDCNSKNLLPSPSIAQAIIESNKGNSTLAKEGNALFGIKADKRWNGKVINKNTKEVYDGVNYVDVNANFRAYDSWEESIADHTDFLLKNKRYSNLVGVRDYKEYCTLIHQDGYATSPTYAQTLINCIESHNLTQYDSKTYNNENTSENNAEHSKLRFNVHAGHNPSGMIASGSVGYINESDENREVCLRVVDKLRSLGHEVYDCTVDDGSSQKDVLKRIVAKCNEHEVDYDISIHFNAIKHEEVSDVKTKGTEVWVYPNSDAINVAQSVCDSISELGFTNCGVKTSDKLYVLKNTKAPALLIECCFVDDVDDVLLYNADKIANAIVKGLTGSAVADVPTVSEDGELYYVVVGAYRSKENAEKFAKHLAENGYVMNDEGNLIRGVITSISKGKL